MALFGSKEKKSPLIKTIKPTVIRTQNVAKELSQIAKSYEVKVDTLDFNLLEVQTYTRMNDGSKETEWESVSNDELYELDDQTALLNPHFQLKQTYEIEIFSPTKETYTPCPALKIAVGANATKCKVYLSIAAGSKIKYSAVLSEDLLNLINKRKVRAGILINIFDEMLKDVISKIVAEVRVAENLEYDKAQTLLIAEGFEPTKTTDDKIVLHYEEKSEVDENTKVDYASRGFIQSVKENELLIEYIKPRLGIAGRNCRGEFMKPTEPVVAHEVTFGVNDTISVNSGDDSIEYRAKENGYIAFEDNVYLIKTDMDVGQISFKTTGSINSGVDSDVSLNVKETDSVKDAIGTGMSVEVTEIDIDGNVGSNANVKALRATIGGQTHKNAVIKADKLDINVHKGKAYGKNIKITRLEHGEVDGNIVEITQALGGKISAKEIDIEICASHVTASATKRIEIQRLQGSENTFIIDPVMKKSVQERLTDNKDTITALETDIKSLTKEISKYTQFIKDGTASFLDIKKRLLHYKKNGVKMPGSFIKKYKQFTHMQEKLKELQREIEVKKDQLGLQTAKTSTFQDNILDARVINRDRWVGYNEIRFRLVEPPMELIYKPAEGSKEKIFGIVELEDGEFMIEAMGE
ncbi:MAG: flagellar assembly protein A [Campylobacterota bacterium]|nr:flagellar assembly protein A [Campylobacterota bacterium]